MSGRESLFSFNPEMEAPMGYVSFEDAQKMSRASLVVKFIETQTMAAAAIAEALTVGGVESERAIMERYEARIAKELRQEVAA